MDARVTLLAVRSAIRDASSWWPSWALLNSFLPEPAESRTVAPPHRGLPATSTTSRDAYQHQADAASLAHADLLDLRVELWQYAPLAELATLGRGRPSRPLRDTELESRAIVMHNLDQGTLGSLDHRSMGAVWVPESLRATETARNH
jgi:hypothetical protein